MGVRQAVLRVVAVALSCNCSSQRPLETGGRGLAHDKPSEQYAQTGEVQISLCWDPDSDRPLDANFQKDLLLRSVGRFVARSSSTRASPSLKYRLFLDATCDERASMGQRTCRTLDNVVMCDISVLARARRMAGWAAALTAALMLKGPVKIGDVPVQLARALSDEEDLDDAVADLWRYRSLADNHWNARDVVNATAFLEYAFSRELGAQPSDIVIESSTPSEGTSLSRLGEMTYAINALASDYALAFILGHEQYHVTNSCDVPTGLPPRVSVELHRLADIQDAGVGVCQNAINAHEFWADECALRHTSEAHRRATYTGAVGEFALRYAIDVTSELLLGGLSDTVGLQEWDHEGIRMARFNRPRGYPYAPLRILTFSELTRTLNPTNFEIGICDATAIHVFHGLTAASYCPEEREFHYADGEWLAAFERHFPARTWDGLRSAPNAAMNNDDDFACGPEDPGFVERDGPQTEHMSH